MSGAELVSEGPRLRQEREIPESLDREFSSENIKKYGEMCGDVAFQLIEFTKEEEREEGKETPRKAILLPSRGAIPIFIGAILATQELLSDESEAQRLLERLEIPPLTCFEPIRDLPKSPASSPIPILLFPFTADVDFGVQGGKITENGVEELVAEMRRFCVRVVAEFYKSPSERNGEEFRRFLKFLEVVEKRKERVEFYQKFPQVDEFIVVDTIISGRASATILSEFKKVGQPFKAILIADKEGEKMQRQYKRVFLYDENVKVFNVPRILTEDRGAAFEGVVAVVYPSLILESKRWGKFVSAGDWYDFPRSNQAIYKKAFFNFLDLLQETFQKVNKEEFERKRRDFLRFIVNQNILKHETPLDYRDLCPLSSQEVKRITETSAHVVQIEPKGKTLESLLGGILNQ